MAPDPAAVAEAMAGAARDWLDSTDTDQRAVACRPFPSDDERSRWFYTPTDHGGLALNAMSPGQQQLAMRLLATGLSEAGFVTAATVIGLENVLDHREGFRLSFPGRERGRDPGMYQVRVFGTPGDRAWGWRFGGHHVSVHATVVGGSVRATPCFLGADPASAPLLGGRHLRPLAAIEDLGRRLVASLDAGQRALALVSDVAPVDIVGGNRPKLSGDDLPLPLGAVFRGPHDADVDAMFDALQRSFEQQVGLSPEHVEAVRLATTPKGLPASAMDADQRDTLRRLLCAYVDRVPEALAAAERDRFAGDGLDGVHFAWAGGTAPGEPHYYRLHGPRLVAEYDNTQGGANHVHSVWRDPDGDFGADLLGDHLAHHPHP